MALPDMIDPANVRQMEPSEYNMRVWADKQAIEVIDRLKADYDALVRTSNSNAVEAVQAKQELVYFKRSAEMMRDAHMKRIADLEAGRCTCGMSGAAPPNSGDVAK